MHKVKITAIFLIAACAITTGSRAQNTYKCGSSYGQTACDGGVVIDVDDKRDKTQKLHAEQVTAKDAKVAEAMEKSRLQKEKVDLSANSPAPGSMHADAAMLDAPNSTSPLKQATPKAAENFVAQGPGSKMKKPAPKKKTKKKKANPT
jgi:hypothetical protein